MLFICVLFEINYMQENLKSSSYMFPKAAFNSKTRHDFLDPAFIQAIKKSSFNILQQAVCYGRVLLQQLCSEHRRSHNLSSIIGGI